MMEVGDIMCINKWKCSLSIFETTIQDFEYSKTFKILYNNFKY